MRSLRRPVRARSSSGVTVPAATSSASRTPIHVRCRRSAKRQAKTIPLVPATTVSGDAPPAGRDDRVQRAVDDHRREQEAGGDGEAVAAAALARADEVAQPGAGQRGVERVRPQAGDAAQDERRHDVLDLAGAEVGHHRAREVLEVLEELEAEPREGAEQQPVVGGADVVARQQEQQDQAGVLRALLDQRRGQRRAPGGGEVDADELGVDREHGVVAGHGEHPRGGQAAPQEPEQRELDGLPREAIGVRDEPDERQRVHGEQHHGQDRRGGVGRDRPGQVVEGERPAGDQQAVDPERGILRLEEADGIRPAGLGDRARAARRRSSRAPRSGCSRSSSRRRASCRLSRFAGPSATAETPTPSCVNANSAPEKSRP